MESPLYKHEPSFVKAAVSIYSTTSHFLVSMHWILSLHFIPTVIFFIKGDLRKSTRVKCHLSKIGILNEDHYSGNTAAKPHSDVPPALTLTLIITKPSNMQFM